MTTPYECPPRRRRYARLLPLVAAVLLSACVDTGLPATSSALATSGGETPDDSDTTSVTQLTSIDGTWTDTSNDETSAETTADAESSTTAPPTTGPTDATSSSGSDEATSSTDGTTGTDGTSSSSDGNSESTTSGSTSECVSTGILDFDDATWDYYTTPNNALAASNDPELVFMPDDAVNVGAAVMYSQGVAMPYTVSFEYSVFDDDGAENGSTFNSADGVSLFVAKDQAAYVGTEPPAGGSLGIIADGTGYAIGFPIFEPRRVEILDGTGNVIAGPITPVPSTYPHGQWRTVSVHVSSAGLEVSYEGAEVLTFVGALDESFDRIGLAAATGGSDGEHRVRNVEVVCD